MTPSPQIDASSLAPSLIGLFAFVVAYYTLVARERKSPLITTSITIVAVTGLFALVFALGERLLTMANSIIGALSAPTPPGTGSSFLEEARLVSLGLSGLFLAVAVVLMLGRVLLIHNIQNRLRSDKLIRNTTTYLSIKTRLRRLWGKPIYEHNAVDFPKDLLQQFSEKLGFGPSLPEHQAAKSLTPSVLVASRRRVDVETQLIELAALALAKQIEVVYTTCSRHPAEFVLGLKARCEASMPGTWPTLVNHIFVIDGFTTHYGFADSIHLLRSADLEHAGISYVRAKRSFSGLHTAAATVFNQVKRKKQAATPRLPQLVIYEGLAGLIDLESPEQFRIFFRHVIPSERQWGGMFTLVIEPSLQESERQFLSGVVDFVAETAAGGPSHG